MYERTGMGFSEIPWYSLDAISCGGGRFDACVTATPEDQEWARQHGCEEMHMLLTGNTRECTTDDRNQGVVHCCHRGFTAEQLEVQDERARAGIAEGVRMCVAQPRLYERDMRNDRQRALLRLQERLCELGFDPGQINGDDHGTHLPEAVRGFQRREGLSETGRVDAETIAAMDFRGAAAASIESGLLNTRVSDRRQDAGLRTLPLLIAGTLGLGLLGFIAYKLK